MRLPIVFHPNYAAPFRVHPFPMANRGCLRARPAAVSDPEVLAARHGLLIGEAQRRRAA